MKNKKNYVLKAILLYLFISVILVLIVEDIIEMGSNGKKWYFISLSIGVIFFIYQFRFGTIRLILEMSKFLEYIRREGQGEESILKLETIIINTYNRKHPFHKVDKTMIENNNYKAFISNDMPNLITLSEIYFFNGKEEKALRIIEQIHDFIAMEFSRPLFSEQMITMYYLCALEIYMEMEDTDKIERYLLEAKPYMERLKEDKGDLGSLICLTHIRYQYLTGNYEQGLKWLNQYSFYEGKNIQVGRYEIGAYLYYALEDMEQSAKYLKQAEENCTNQWAKDKLYSDYENMKKRVKEKHFQSP